MTNNGADNTQLEVDVTPNRKFLQFVKETYWAIGCGVVAAHWTP